jgi:hypothetical protein
MIEEIGEWFTGPSRKELHRKIDKLEYKLEDQKDTSRALRRELDNLKKEKAVSGMAIVTDAPFNLADKFFVKEHRPGSEKEYIVARSGCQTYEAALKIAQESAVKFPSNVYTVVGVLASVKAEIPIATTIVAKPVQTEEKVDTEKKD